jgi:hypothetical protein
MPEHTVGTREEWRAARDDLAKIERARAVLTDTQTSSVSDH